MKFHEQWKEINKLEISGKAGHANFVVKLQITACITQFLNDPKIKTTDNFF